MVPYVCLGLTAPASRSARPLVAGMSGYAQQRQAVIHRIVEFCARLDQRSHYYIVARSSGDVQRHQAVICQIIIITSTFSGTSKTSQKTY